MSTFNKLGARKEIGAIFYRLDDEHLDRDIKRRIIKRHICNLAETLPTEFTEILLKLGAANTFGEYDEVRAGCILLQNLIPTTLGAMPAGLVARLPDGRIFIKRKDCLELYASCDTLEPIPYDTQVTIL